MTAAADVAAKLWAEWEAPPFSSQGGRDREAVRVGESEPAH